MKDRITQQDITDYALNELAPRERLYVESMMLGADDLRGDACSMIEMARLLEQGFEAEVEWQGLCLGADRKNQILAQPLESSWQVVGRVAAAVVGLAACVAFSVSAPVVWNMAMRTDSSPAKAEQQVAQTTSVGPVSAASVVTPTSDSGFFSFQVSSGEESTPVQALLPTGNVGFMEMPLPSISVDLN